MSLMLLMNELNNMLSPSRLSFSLSFRSFTPIYYGIGYFKRPLVRFKISIE